MVAAAVCWLWPDGVGAQPVMDLDALAEEDTGRTEPIPTVESPSPSASGPVVAGQMTEAAAAAKKAFDREHWMASAIALQRVIDGQTGDDQGNRQLAEYYRAIALHRLELYGASGAAFVAIADNPNHLKFKETYLWLAKLSTSGHASPEVIAQMCSYEDRQIARFDNAQQRDLYWHSNLICARYRFDRQQYVEAIRLAGRVEPTSAHFGAARVVAANAYCARGQLDAARRLLRATLTQVPRQEREALRQVLRRLENRYDTPTPTWRNPARQYWQRRGFVHHTR